MREVKIPQLEKPSIAAKPNGNLAPAADLKGIPARFAGKLPSSDGPSKCLRRELIDIAIANGGILPGKKKCKDKYGPSIERAVRNNGYFEKTRAELEVREPYQRGEKSLARPENINPVLDELTLLFGKFPAQTMLKREHFLASFDPDFCAFEAAAGEFFSKKGMKTRLALNGTDKAALSALMPVRTGGYVVRMEEGALKLYLGKRNDVIGAVRDHHGGFCEVRKKRNLKLARRDGKYALSHGTNFIDMALGIRKKYGRIPEKETLLQDGYSDFLHELTRRKTGLNAMRKRFNEKQHRLEGKETLRKWENLLPAIHAMMRKEGLKILPDGKWEGWKNYGPEHAAIKRNGGLGEVRETVGICPQAKTEIQVYWKWEKVASALEKPVEAKGHLPPIEWFAGNQKYDLLLQSIFTFHGDFWQVRMRMEAEGRTRRIYPKNSTSRFARMKLPGDSKPVEPVVL